MTDDRGRPVSAGELDADDDPAEAAYTAMAEFAAGRNLPGHELAGLWCVARAGGAEGMVDGRDW